MYNYNLVSSPSNTIMAQNYVNHVSCPMIISQLMKFNVHNVRALPSHI